MRNLWKMKMDELRAVAVELGADKSKLYGTSKQAIIVMIHKLEKNTEATTTTDTTETPETPKEESTMTKATTTTTTTTTTKKPRAKRTTKKAAEPTTVTVVLKAFTGMKIAIYTGKLNEKEQTITITTKAGKDMEFNLDGTQKVDTKAGARFNNKIEVITEA